MKRICVDMGNSAIKWANANDIDGTARRSAHVQDCLGAIAAGGADEVLISCVAATRRLKEFELALQQQTSAAIIIAHTEGRLGPLHNAYPQPTHLGVDRWLTMRAAYDRHGGPVSIADAGTALTLDAVDESGRHLGGLIAPGPELAEHAVTARASGVFSDSKADVNWLAQDTPTAIRSGAFLSNAALIEVFHRQVWESSHPGKLILCGGLASVLKPFVYVETLVDPHLVLHGLVFYRHESDNSHR